MQELRDVTIEDSAYIPYSWYRRHRVTVDPGAALAMIATGDSEQFESCAAARTGPRRGTFPALWNNSEEDDNQGQQGAIKGNSLEEEDSYSGGIFSGLSMFT